MDYRMTSEYMDMKGRKHLDSSRGDGKVRGKMGDVYNLNGQKVGDSYRGIIIKNGRKLFKR